MGTQTQVWPGPKTHVLERQSTRKAGRATCPTGGFVRSCYNSGNCLRHPASGIRQLRHLSNWSIVLKRFTNSSRVVLAMFFAVACSALLSDSARAQSVYGSRSSSSGSLHNYHRSTPSIAGSGTTTYRDSSGRQVGSAYSLGGTQSFRDPYGRQVGSSSSFGGTTTYRDPYGRQVGSSANFGGTTTYRDPYGRQTGSSSSFGGTTTYRDPYGRQVGSASNFGGTTTYRDSYGRQTGSSSTFGGSPRSIR